MTGVLTTGEFSVLFVSVSVEASVTTGSSENTRRSLPFNPRAKSALLALFRQEIESATAREMLPVCDGFADLETRRATTSAGKPSSLRLFEPSMPSARSEEFALLRSEEHTSELQSRENL